MGDKSRLKQWILSTALLSSSVVAYLIFVNHEDSSQANRANTAKIGFQRSSHPLGDFRPQESQKSQESPESQESQEFLCPLASGKDQIFLDELSFTSEHSRAELKLWRQISKTQNPQDQIRRTERGAHFVIRELASSITQPREILEETPSRKRRDQAKMKVKVYAKASKRLVTRPKKKRVPARVDEPSLVQEKSSSSPDLELTATKTEKDSKGRPVSVWLWAGFGANYQYYQQTIPSIEGDSKFQNITAPTILGRAGFQGESWGLDLSLKDTPGVITSSETIEVLGGNYHWQTLTVEGLYHFESDENSNFRFGIQHHLVPFMYLRAQEFQVEIKKNFINMATLGYERFYLLAPKTRVEFMGRYQFPIMSGAADGAKFQINPRFSFDGSVGGVYGLSDVTKLGVYWYGQWHDYDFTYQPLGGELSQGKQVLFYSNIEFRLGFEF